MLLLKHLELLEQGLHEKRELIQVEEVETNQAHITKSSNLWRRMGVKKKLD